MSTRKLIVLGTSAQVPTRERNHSAYFLYWDQHGFLVDCGEGTQRQLTQFHVKASSISKILITHFHGDHCFGLPGILQRINLDKSSHKVDIYFPASGMEYFEKLIAISFYSNSLEVIPHPIYDDGVIFEDKSMQLEAFQLDHPIETYGYRIREHDTVVILPEKLKEFDLKGPEIGKLKEEGSIRKKQQVISLRDVSKPRKGQTVAFVFDTRYCENALKLAQQADLLICESTFSSEHRELAESYGHLTAEQAATVARQASANHLVITHFSQRYLDTKALLKEAKVIHFNTVAAEDGDIIELPSRKKTN